MDLDERFWGKGPFPFDPDDPRDKTVLYPSSKMVLIVASNLNCREAAVHAHSSYEFSMPHAVDVPCRLGRGNATMRGGRVFPFNPEEEHGPAGPMTNTSMTGLMVAQDYLQEMSCAMYGKADVRFERESACFGSDLHLAVERFATEYQNRQKGYKFVMESLGAQIAVDILRNLPSNVRDSSAERRYSEKENIARTVEYMSERFNETYSLAELAQVARLSLYHFIRVFKAETGTTPHDFFLSIKIDRACQLLKHSEKNVTEICYCCGFTNVSHFSSAFKKKMGVSPSRYREIFAPGN